MTHLIADHGYLAVFVLMVLESMFVPIPSEAIMLYGGALAAGAVGARYGSWWTFGLVGTAGNLVGSLIGYAIGRYGGEAVVGHRSVSWLIRPHHVQKATAFFARRGELAVAVGRVIPVVRTFISLPAGLAEMPVARFALFTTIGCLPWTFALAGVGYAVGRNYDHVAHGFTPVSIVVAVVLVVALVVWWRRNADAPASGPDDERLAR